MGPKSGHWKQKARENRPKNLNDQSGPLEVKSTNPSHIKRESPIPLQELESNATGFYGHPDTGKRRISWSLLKSLNKQCNMPWVVLGDFNEITCTDEKLGWLDRDASQMWEFRGCLSKCGLTDLGFVGQRYTWCNGRVGDHRTLIKLDRVVTNEAWRRMFTEASVHHLAMSASDHCMIAPFLKRKKSCKTNEEKCFV